MLNLAIYLIIPRSIAIIAVSQRSENIAKVLRKAKGDPLYLRA